MPRVPTCGHPDRRVFSGWDCKECANKKYAIKAALKRTPAKASPPRVAVSKVSPLQGILNAIYAIISAELKPLHPVCEGKLSGCTHKATDIHHMKGRKGFLLILSKYFKYLCRNCHDFCTVHSKEAKEMGLSLPINSETDYEFTEREAQLIEQFKLRRP